jgi:hypothetical protein
MALIAGIVLVAVVAAACDSSVKRRPYGNIKLGLAAELGQHPETFFSEARILLRYRDGGFSAMSTTCTYDLSALTRVNDGTTKRWLSSYTSSAYDDEGRVLSGPTRAALPFYRMRLAAGTYGGTPDTLFVEVGQEVDQNWRLPWK